MYKSIIEERLTSKFNESHSKQNYSELIEELVSNLEPKVNDELVKTKDLKKAIENCINELGDINLIIEDYNSLYGNGINPVLENIENNINPSNENQSIPQANIADPKINSGNGLFKILNIIGFSYPLFITIVYLLIGVLGNMWGTGWLLFLTIPIFYSLKMSTYENDSINILGFLNKSVPMIILICYLLFNFCFNDWGTSWLLFLLIPIYYIFVRRIIQQNNF